jgi:prolyl-tRNA synthetase
LASGNVVLKRRDTGTKEIVSQSELKARIEATLAEQQSALHAAAKERLKQNYVTADSLPQVEEILRDVTAEKGGGKFVFAHIKDDPQCDARLKEFKATVRCIPLIDEHDGPGKCILTGEPVARRAVIAKAY